MSTRGNYNYKEKGLKLGQPIFMQVRFLNNASKL